jgi:hypothetical protein
MTQVKYAGRSYIIEFGIVAALYTGLVVARPYLTAMTPDATLRMVAMALPILPIWGMLLVVVRYYRRIDELQRLRLLENVSIATGIAACLITSYALLEDAGLPKLAITWAWPTLAVCWGATTGINELRGR